MPGMHGPHPVERRERRRWRFQFSLRTFLVVLVAISAAAGLFFNHVYRQRHAATILRDAGMTIWFGIETPNRSFFPRDAGWSGKIFGDQFRAQATSVYSRGYRRGQPTLIMQLRPRHFAALQELPHLSRLSLFETSTTDADLAYLIPISTLKSLSLWGTAVDDAGMPTIARLRALQVLDLTGLPISDSGLKALAGHPRIYILSIVNTKVGDPSIDTLVSLPALRHVHIQQTHITKLAVARLKRERPDITIYGDPRVGLPFP